MWRTLSLFEESVRRPGTVRSVDVDIVTILIFVLAVHRGTRLAVRDEVPIMAIPRNWILDAFGKFDDAGNLVGARRWGPLGWSLAYVFTCDWCMSIWVGLFLVGACALTGVHLPVPWLLILAASSVTGLIAEREK